MIDQYPPANGVLTSLIWRKTAAGGETSLSGYDNASQALSYTPGQEQVYLNGILLVRGDDYTATNGTSITGLSALSASDFVQVNCYNNFSVASVPATSITGTVSNAQLQNSSITINGSPVSLGGSVSLPGDIEGVTAGIGISGGGTSGTVTITNDMATTISAKGDLVVGTANDAYAALTVGANNTVLTADSTTATGLKWASPSSGAVVQVKSLTTTGYTSVAGGSSADTQLSLSITPTSSSNKILVIVTQPIVAYRSGAAPGESYINLVRNSTDLGTYAKMTLSNVTVSGLGLIETVASLSTLDSPATTSTITYKTVLYKNGSGTVDTDSRQTMILIEVTP